MPSNRHLVATIFSTSNRSCDFTRGRRRACLGTNSERSVHPVALIALCLVIPVDRSEPVCARVLEFEGVGAFAVDGSVRVLVVSSND